MQRSARGLRLSWLSSAIHALVFAGAVFLIARARDPALRGLISNDRIPLLIAFGTTFTVLVLLTASARAHLSGVKMWRWAMLALFIPPIATIMAFELLIGRATREHAALTTPIVAATKFAIAVGEGLDVLVLGAFGSSIALSSTAALLALSAWSRARRIEFRQISLVAIAMVGLGAIPVALLPGNDLLLLVVPLAFGAIVIGLVAATLDGRFRAGDGEAAPQAAVDGLIAALLAFGAVALGSLALGSARVGAGLGAVGAAAVGDDLVAAQRGWSDGISLLRWAALAALPLPAATAVVFIVNAARVGRKARTRVPELVLSASVVLLTIAGLRVELVRAARAAAAQWSPEKHSSLRLPTVAADALHAPTRNDLESALVIDRSRVRQAKRDLGDVNQLDSDPGCVVVVSRLERPRPAPLTVAADASMSFRRMSCLLRALSVVSTAYRDRCEVAFLARPHASSDVSPLPPFDTAEPLPLAIPIRSLTGLCAVDRPPVTLRLTASSWSIERAQAPAMTRSGDVEELEGWARAALAGRAALLDADADVPVAMVLAAAAAIANTDSRALVLAESESPEPDPTSAAERPPAARPTDESPLGVGSVNVEFQPVAVSGGLFPTEVQARVETLRERIEQCTDGEGGAPLDHLITVRFVISRGGSVVHVTPDSETQFVKSVAGCIYLAFYRLGFPTPTEGPVRVRAPVRIRR
jgi:hypothetical protein